jgi:hypothetical protein
VEVAQRRNITVRPWGGELTLPGPYWEVSHSDDRAEGVDAGRALIEELLRTALVLGDLRAAAELARLSR